MAFSGKRTRVSTYVSAWMPTGDETPEIRALFGGGLKYAPDVQYDTIDYVAIATTGNATDFGDLTVGRYGPAGCASTTRGIFSGGRGSGGITNTIDYITTASAGNATDFGDLTAARWGAGACSNGHGGLG